MQLVILNRLLISRFDDTKRLGQAIQNVIVASSSPNIKTYMTITSCHMAYLEPNASIIAGNSHLTLHHTFSSVLNWTIAALSISAEQDKVVIDDAQILRTRVNILDK